MRVLCSSCRQFLRSSRCNGLNFRSLKTSRNYSTYEEPSGNLGNSYIPKRLLPVELPKLGKNFHIPRATRRDNLLTAEDVGRSHTLHGWLLVPHRKVSKDLQFFQLRDSQGNILQLCSSVDIPSSVTSETPVAVTGIIRQRPEHQRREGIGEYELEINEISPLNSVQFTLPFQPSQAHDVNAATRARYRYLDLRNKLNHSYLRLRDEIVSNCRTILRKEGFMEIETPLLFKSTPEGAREFIVPTRRKGEVYALPQSPQQYKQILMASGIDRYFQVAKCFRDEDLRADRQPEFTQLDLEMGFSGSEDVMGIIELLIKEVWNNVFPGSVDINIPFVRMSYQHAMSKYGSDKPDTRYEILIQDVPDFCGVSGLSTLVVRNGANLSSKVRRALCDEAKGATDDYIASTVYHNFPDSKPWHENISRLRGALTGDIYIQLNESLGLQHNDALFLAIKPDAFTGGTTVLGRARSIIIRHLIEMKVLEPTANEFKFLWVTDFPLFSPDLHEKSDPGQGGSAGIRSTHHPFTAPQISDLSLLAENPLSVKGQHYDLVVNGVELGGGSVRIHDADLQHYVLHDILRLPENRIREFAHLLEALASGCPPHAGIALGLDRMIALLAGTNSIRDVIAFPKTASGSDVLVGSPSKIDDKILEEYHLRYSTPAT